jgi:Spy/CpxP family protein refolding chaperone
MKWLSLLALTALTLASAAAAQRRSDIDSRRDRMRTFLVLRISEALDLPEEKALQIGRILREAGEKRRDLVGQRRDVERKLRNALAQTGGSDPAALAALIAQANELNAQIAMIPEISFKEVQGVLTVEQQARLVLLRPELQAQIRRNVERRLRAK